MTHYLSRALSCSLSVSKSIVNSQKRAQGRCFQWIKGVIEILVENFNMSKEKVHCTLATKIFMGSIIFIMYSGLFIISLLEDMVDIW